MSGDEGIVDALHRLGEAGDAAELPDGGHLLPPACEHLVWVALMAHVKDQAVLPGVKHPVDGHRKPTTPKLEARCPPVRATSRISSCRSWPHSSRASWSPIPARMGPYEVVLSLLSKKKNPSQLPGRRRSASLPVYQIMGPVMPMAVPSRAPHQHLGERVAQVLIQLFFGLELLRHLLPVGHHIVEHLGLLPQRPGAHYRRRTSPPGPPPPPGRTGAPASRRSARWTP